MLKGSVAAERRYTRGGALWNRLRRRFAVDLPAHYQYFGDARLGGVLAMADFCPMRHAYTMGDGRMANDCRDPRNVDDPSMGTDLHAEKCVDFAACCPSGGPTSRPSRRVWHSAPLRFV